MGFMMPVRVTNNDRKKSFGSYEEWMSHFFPKSLKEKNKVTHQADDLHSIGLDIAAASLECFNPSPDDVRR